jgi:Na+-transporting NADH:ubiquinone oxidoreductase subunit A
MIKIKKGLDLPINGKPEQEIRGEKGCETMALLGPDYEGMKPTMEVRIADKVKKGQLLCSDKKIPGVRFTSPGGGEVVAIHRGEKRALLSIVIRPDHKEEEITFRSFSQKQLGGLQRQQIVELLVESGEWTAFRTRPYSKTPHPDSQPHAIFVTATDTHPLAPSIHKILDGKEADFANGLTVISKLTAGKLYVCKAPGATLPAADLPNLAVEEFDGPHPAGLPGTHIHFLAPVSRKRMVWHIGSQDVIAIGRLFTTGKIFSERIVALGGVSLKNPRLLRTRAGASLFDITAGELNEGEHRVISGSVLSGRQADGSRGFLGRFHQQISVIPENRKRKFLGWLNPFANIHSVKNIFLSGFIPNKTFDFDTAINGEERAIIPSGGYEKVMPLDIMPLFLLRALAVNDVEEAEKLGCLELDEEDLALCAYVCPSKLEFGPLLRRNLTLIEKEG